MSTNSAQFVWPTNFACTIISEKIIIPNSYNLNVSIVPIGGPATNVSLGFKKIRYFVDNYLHNSVFVSQDNPLLPNLKDFESTIVLFPTDPYDYYVGSVLYQKLLSITEKYFHIDIFSIDSAIGDNVQYSIVDPEDCGLDLQGDHWWNSDSVNTGFNTSDTWKDLDIFDDHKFEPRIIKGGKSEN